MLLSATYSSLLIAVLVRTSSAAAIDSDLRGREVPKWATNWINGAVNNLPGAVGGAVSNAENRVVAAIPGALLPNSQNCPKIIEKTNWDKYLGVAPIAAAIHKPCHWKDIMTDLWDGIKCGGNCLMAFIQEDLNILQDAHCAKCIGQVVMETLPCINAAGGFQGLCTKAIAIPEFGPCLTGTADTPGICPKGPPIARVPGT